MARLKLTKLAEDEAVPEPAYATVTETAILRGKVESLVKLVLNLAELANKHEEEIRKLRRQVKALRDGAVLEDEC